MRFEAVPLFPPAPMPLLSLVFHPYQCLFPVLIEISRRGEYQLLTSSSDRSALDLFRGQVALHGYRVDRDHHLQGWGCVCVPNVVHHYRDPIGIRDWWSDKRPTYAQIASR